jgi:transposase
MQLPTKEDIHNAYINGEETLTQLIQWLISIILKQEEAILKQEEAINELQNKLSKNSQNSSKPPSSDGYRKANRTTSLRQTGKKPKGGQLGHEGHTLKATDNPDIIEVYEVENCTNCNASLKNVHVNTYEERQVFDIPVVRMKVTSHRAEMKICPKCGAENKGKFPESVNQPTQYGNEVKSWASYFTNQHFISVERTREIFEDLVNHRVSEGTIIKASEELSECISPAVEAIKEQIRNADVIHNDESGVRVTGKLHWLHVASTNRATDYEVHAKRGKEGMESAGILSKFKGKAVHDHWKPYFNYENCGHALCNAHHLRELKFIEERHEQNWAKEMTELLVEIKDTVEGIQPEAEALTIGQIIEFEKQYDKIIQRGFEANPVVVKEKSETEVKKGGRVKQSAPINLLVRLRDFKKETLTFMYDFRAPFDNNLAERDIRMIKVKQKVSGGFRTTKGAKNFGRIRGYISTVRKNAVNVFQAIRGAFCWNPFIPLLTPN